MIKKYITLGFGQRKSDNHLINWLGGVSENWKIDKFKNLFTIGSGSTPESNNSQYWDGDIVWITPADFKTEDIFILSGERNISKKGFNSCSTKMVPQNSIILSKRAPIGSVVINTKSLCTNQGCLSLIKKKNINIKFYYYLLSVCAEYLNVIGRGTTFKELSMTDFGNIFVPAPSLSEQNLIVKYLDEKCDLINTLLKTKQRKIDELKKYKKSLIYECVSGKKEVF